MKKLFLFVAVVISTISAIASDQFYVIMKDGSAESFPSEKVDSITFDDPQIANAKGFNDLMSEIEKLKKEIETLKSNGGGGNITPGSNSMNGYDYIDLGLPSGLKWSTKNVGALNPEGYGISFRGFEQNAAASTWGNLWGCPTRVEFNELLNNCTWTWTEYEGVDGYKVASKVNDNWIFLPVASGTGSTRYWTSICDYEHSYCLVIGPSSKVMDESLCYYTGSVRPVLRGVCYTVSFFDKDKNLIKTQTVEKGNPAKGPETQSVDGYVFAGWDKDISNVQSDLDVYAQYFVGGNVDGHEYVDLGLPSGLKWATMNVGAASIKEYGSYFAWGEVAPAPDNDYSKANCKAYKIEASELKASGVIDANGNLTTEHDAASQNWGGKWRMPTKAEYDELVDNCTWTWTKYEGVNGYKVASKVNDNWIFLPAAGDRNGTPRYGVGSIGYYWSSTVYESNSGIAYCLYFTSSSRSTEDTYRYLGFTVRAVTE